MDFGEEISRGAALFESGRLAEAAEVFKGQCEDVKVAPMGRAIAAVNLAVTYDKMGHSDHALATYEFGVSVVTDGYVFAQEHRAGYLLTLGRVDEAIAVWEGLLELDFVAPERADAFRHNLNLLVAQRGG